MINQGFAKLWWVFVCCLLSMANLYATDYVVKDKATIYMDTELSDTYMVAIKDTILSVLGETNSISGEKLYEVKVPDQEIEIKGYVKKKDLALLDGGSSKGKKDTAKKKDATPSDLDELKMEKKYGPKLQLSFVTGGQTESYTLRTESAGGGLVIDSNLAPAALMGIVADYYPLHYRRNSFGIDFKYQLGYANYTLFLDDDILSEFSEKRHAITHDLEMTLKYRLYIIDQLKSLVYAPRAGYRYFFFRGNDVTVDGTDYDFYVNSSVRGFMFEPVYLEYTLPVGDKTRDYGVSAGFEMFLAPTYSEETGKTGETPAMDTLNYFFRGGLFMIMSNYWRLSLDYQRLYFNTDFSGADGNRYTVAIQTGQIREVYSDFTFSLGVLY